MNTTVHANVMNSPVNSTDTEMIAKISQNTFCEKNSTNQYNTTQRQLPLLRRSCRHRSLKKQTTQRQITAGQL